MPQVALLVDDEQALRAYVSAVLRLGGFNVLEAADGKDALAVLQRFHGTVDVLVTDIKMPRMTGLELVAAVKTDFPVMPVVYISGESFGEELRSPGARVLCLQKPFEPQEILDAVRTVIAPVSALPS